MHLFRSAHLDAVCPGCGNKHEKVKGKPVFWKEVHYFTFICECGYETFIRTKHMHSGHY
ncbi:hypothetical protein JW711_00650 [Candidatus Woesearchaeota archaeon]|nr:hypothetical protein [Candidatus Woesearchaeota archaeon]